MNNKTLHRIRASLFVIVMVLGIAELLLLLGPLIEQKYFPVMVDGHIVIAEESDNQKITSLKFQATKIRDCVWEDTRWYFGKYKGRSTFVESKHTAKPQIRDKGIHVWEALLVSLPEFVLRSNSYSVVVHSCHPFWNSYSLFYNGTERTDLLKLLNEKYDAVTP